MKRQRRRSAANTATQSNAASNDGPLGRRRTLRHLHSLAQETAHEPSPTAATAHVRVLDEPGSSLASESVTPRCYPQTAFRFGERPGVLAKRLLIANLGEIVSRGATIHCVIDIYVSCGQPREWPA